jgi:hypothetical protein
MTCPLRNNKEILARGGQMIQWRRGQRPVVRKLDRALWRKHVAATTVRPRRGPQGCKAILGTWKWAKGTVSFTGNGRSGSATARGNPNIRSGVWRCTGPKTVKITWDGGKYTDTVRLSGNALSVTNQNGYHFRASRSSRPSKRPTGERCVWRKGSMVYAGGCICTNAQGVTYPAPHARCGR